MTRRVFEIMSVNFLVVKIYIFLVLFSVRGRDDLKATVWPEGLGH
jgi:hypothetical protein